MLSLLLSLFFLSFSSSSFSSASLFSWPQIFPQHRFTSESLISLSSLGLPKTGLIASWGDFNRDQLTDLVYLSYDQRSLSVWNWNRKEYVWKESEKLKIRTRSEFVVTNVVSGDFNGDGRVDLLVYGEKNPGDDGGWWRGNKDKTTEMKVYLQDSKGGFKDPIDLDSSTLPQAMPLDLTGNLLPDLLGFSPSSSSSLPQIWLNTATPSSNSSSLFTPTDASSRFDFSTHPSGGWSCQFPTPHFNAFIDLDGDCLADLFLTCLKNPDDKEDQGLRYEVWVNTKGTQGEGGGGGKFEWKRGGDLPKGTKSVGFADMGKKLFKFPPLFLVILKN